MKRLLTLAIATALLLAILAGSASAGVIFGVRQFSYHNTILPTDQGQGAYFGFAPGEDGRFVITGGIDYWSYKLSVTLPADTAASLPELDGDISMGSFMLRGGAKFYLKPPEQGTVTAVFAAELFKAFGNAKLSAEGASADIEPVKDALAPYGVMLSFGGEYFISDVFSVNGDLGLRYVITKVDADLGVLGDIGELVGLEIGMGEGAEVKFTTITMYTGLGLSFRF
ncbi:MAG: hypothetical protein OEW00_10940 [candidate division Zixibacteria bacterium]|nr:hypothetical protein [candidate division Zixibacteria bacterium]